MSVESMGAPKNISFPFPDMEMLLVSAGQFKMGEDMSDYEDERPAHEVTIANDYYLGKYPVTQALYEAMMGKNPSRFPGPQRPVEQVSWDDTQSFIQALNKEEAVQQSLRNQGLAGYIFRLPSEAEWEYAARGGMQNRSQGYQYSGSDGLAQVGWYDENSGGETKPVGLLLPNELGLHDMSGNVDEWCEDDWHVSYDLPERPDDGRAWMDSPRGTDRVLRGGDYLDNVTSCRPAFRNLNSPGTRYHFFGFRLVLSSSSVQRAILES